MAIIEAHNLTKRFRLPVKSPGLAGALRHVVRPYYEHKLAVDHIDLVIEAGESVAYVGPNGAGKSTTIKMLTGILSPTEGEVVVHGLVPFRQRVANARNIGVVFGQRTQLWWDLPVQESLRLIGDMYTVPADVYRRRFDECVDFLELAPLLTKPARQLSLGQRMRCDLAASLLHAPPILYLDEPTIGLDIAVKARIRQYIKRSNQEHGVTVLLTSHDLGDIEDLCSRLVMIDRGTIVFDGPLQLIKERFGQERVVHFMLHKAVPEAAATAQGLLPELPPVAIQQAADHQLTVTCDVKRLSVGTVTSRLVSALPVNDLRIEEPSVEKIILQLYQGTLQFEAVTP